MVWVLVFGFILIGGAWKSAVAIAYDLTKLKSVCLMVEVLPADARRDLSMDEREITNQVYAWLKGKLPRLLVEQHTRASMGACAAGTPELWVVVTLGTTKLGGRILGHYGNVSIRLTRSVLWESGREGRGIAYLDDMILKGRMEIAGQNVNGALESLLDTFAAEYYKAGNP